VNALEWLARNADDLADALLDHLILTSLAVLGGLAISLALTVVIRLDPRWQAPVTGVAGVLYTIPSLALFAVLVPVTGLSVLTAEIGLVSYTLLILVGSLVSGLAAVPSDVREASAGMGLSTRQQLLHVELPLAIPYLIGGLRVAAVTTIGLVMVTALIGEGGLGQLMLRGFNFRNWTAVYAGAILTVGLAIVIDMGLMLLGRALTPWSRRGAVRQP
jgi:osmoprotectant transport system permease protein